MQPFASTGPTALILAPAARGVPILPGPVLGASAPGLSAPPPVNVSPAASPAPGFALSPVTQYSCHGATTVSEEEFGAVSFDGNGDYTWTPSTDGVWLINNRLGGGCLTQDSSGLTTLGACPDSDAAAQSGFAYRILPGSVQNQYNFVTPELLCLNSESNGQFFMATSCNANATYEQLFVGFSDLNKAYVGLVGRGFRCV